MDLRQHPRWHPSGWHRIALAGGAAAVAAGLLAACGPTGGASSGDFQGSQPAASGQPSPGQSAGMPTAGLPARLAIRQDWQSVFDSREPLAMRQLMLQNGWQFAAALKTQAGPAAVTSVTLGPRGQATVRYQLQAGGKPQQQSGMAVYQDGTWKVSDASFCHALGAAGGHAGALPPACHGG